MKLWGQAGRGQGVTSLHFAYPFPRFAPPHHSILSSFTSPANLPPPPLPCLPAATCRQAAVPAIPSPAVLLLPSFFIKLLKRQSGSVVVAWYPACWPSQSAQLQRRPARRILAPSSNQMAALRFSGSNGILSVAIGTIGKQRHKMNYSVSSSSLMDKRTERPRTLRCAVLCCCSCQ